MKLTLLLLSVVTHGSAELCEIKTAKDLETPQTCTELKLDVEHDVMMSPNLFHKIKTASTYHYFKLCNSTLDLISEADKVYLPKGATLEITDNAYLRELPEFIIADGKDVNLVILGNPKVDTTQLLNECKAKGCTDQTLSTIQVPYSCKATSPLPKECHVLFGTVPLNRYDKSWDNVEIVHGTLSLQNSGLDSFPKMEKLVKVEQVANTPVLVVENNANLRDVDALFKINFNVKKKENAVRVNANPKLCIEKNNAVLPFAAEFLNDVKQCDRPASANVEDHPKSRVIRGAAWQDEDGAGEVGSGTEAPVEGATGGGTAEAEAGTGAAHTGATGGGASDADAAHTGAMGTGAPNGRTATGGDARDEDVTGGTGNRKAHTKPSRKKGKGATGEAEANTGATGIGASDAGAAHTGAMGTGAPDEGTATGGGARDDVRGGTGKEKAHTKPSGKEGKGATGEREANTGRPSVAHTGSNAKKGAGTEKGLTMGVSKKSSFEEGKHILVDDKKTKKYCLMERRKVWKSSCFRCYFRDVFISVSKQGTSFLGSSRHWAMAIICAVFLSYRNM
ncbi:hypothetical protein Y032_0801g2421 [Ancylostoma ceylanicum]|nr:hypothetical protein Y032_0801g2421 [Ancylostoma ceylanicum]